MDSSRRPAAGVALRAVLTSSTCGLRQLRSVLARRPAAQHLAFLALLAVLLAAAAPPADPWVAARARMVEEQIRARGVADPEVLAAMAAVPRHLFVPDEQRDLAYVDRPLPIGWGQTISQPYIVALMCSLLELEPGDKVLEIGTGSGYHAAVLSRLGGRVHTIEIVEPLGERARRTLAAAGFGDVQVRIGDGYAGWPEEAPFDAIVLTAAPPKVPQPLLDQLAVGGRMVVPVGGFWQELKVFRKTPSGIESKAVAPVRFVPMTGRAQQKR